MKNSLFMLNNKSIKIVKWFFNFSHIKQNKIRQKHELKINLYSITQ